MAVFSIWGTTWEPGRCIHRWIKLQPSHSDCTPSPKNTSRFLRLAGYYPGSCQALQTWPAPWLISPVTVPHIWSDRQSSARRCCGEPLLYMRRPTPRTEGCFVPAGKGGSTDQFRMKIIRAGGQWRKMKMMKKLLFICHLQLPARKSAWPSGGQPILFIITSWF